MNRQFLFRYPLWITKMNVKKIVLVIPVIALSDQRLAVFRAIISGLGTGLFDLVRRRPA
jgi:hypothetical protein